MNQEPLNPVGSSATESLDRNAAAPRSIGGYRIIRVLGEGGMAIVYEAEQQHPRRAVALKVIRGGRHVGEHEVKLFQREAQALALLKHPGIGAIYEAGRTDDGQHFFAMELVRGEPLHRYVAARNLPVRDRLALFRRICEAVNYAHQRGVMHRDLKPSNILIDAEGNPKILDFGLARITDADVAVTTTVSEIGRVVGTLAYMSPEQARGNPDEIDLRSDVYSLGVILYELLTGQLPYDVHRAMLPEAVRVICEERPRRPSTLNRTLRGDVETIALKGLAKEPHRRYASAAALADDVERYLTDQPILARPPSAAYQFRKLVARHKGPFAFVTTVLALLIALGIAMSVLYVRAVENESLAATEAQRANAEADRAGAQARKAEALAVVMLKYVLQLREAFGGGPDDESIVAWKEEEITFRRMIEHEAEALLDDLFESRPAVKALTRVVLGQVYLGDGLYPEASRFFSEALVFARAQGDVSGMYEACLYGLSESLMQMQDYAGAERVLREYLRVSRFAEPRLGECLFKLARYQEAEPFLRRHANEHRRRMLGECLTRFELYEEAERELLSYSQDLPAPWGEGHPLPAGDLDSEIDETLHGIVDLYDAWHAAEPQAGHDARASEWRAKLEAWQASTQPASQPPSAPAEQSGAAHAR